MVSSAQKRLAAKEVVASGLCLVRRACEYLNLHPSSYYYKSKPIATKLRSLLSRIVSLSIEFPRYGYRRIRALLEREGWQVSQKLVQRVRREEGLKVSLRKAKRVRRGQSTSLPTQASYPNHVWSWDFVHDRTDRGGPLRMMTLIDEYTRRCLKIEVARSLKSADVLKVLQEAIGDYGAPSYIRSDNGSEFIAKTIRKSLADYPIQIIYIDPGSPWQNGFVESFHNRLRDECLNQELFLSVTEAQVVINQWKDTIYNEIHPHSALGWMSPNAFFNKILTQSIDFVSPTHSLRPLTLKQQYIIK